MFLRCFSSIDRRQPGSEKFLRLFLFLPGSGADTEYIYSSALCETRQSAALGDKCTNVECLCYGASNSR